MVNIQPKDTSKNHFFVSIIKSAVRVAAGSALIMNQLVWAGALLIVAELLGIIEELV